MSSASVALYVYGEELDPGQITILTGVSPDTARSKGDRREVRTGISTTQKTGVWSRYVETDADGIAASASALLEEFDNINYRIDSISSVDSVNFDIYCSIGIIDIDRGEFSFVLPQSIVQRISELGASLTVTLGVTR